ncbi:hypothetical protein FKM82_027989, partial [Ascaphus truei]
KRFLRQRQAAVKLQATWRGYHGRKTYAKMRHGFQRLQALVRGRQLCEQYQRSRKVITQLQAQSRGYLLRKRVAQQKKAVLVLQTFTRGMLARKRYQGIKRRECMTRQEMEQAEKRKMMQQDLLKQQEKDNLEMVERVFGFLPSVLLDEIDLDTIPMDLAPEKDMDHLAEFTFPKFAATYFQGSATDTHTRKPLHQPLLYHEDHGDVV